MLNIINTRFQYERLNRELEKYSTRFTVESAVKIDKDLYIKGYGFNYKNEVYHIIRDTNGKYSVCKIKNTVKYGTYSDNLSYKQLLTVLKNLLK